MTDKDREELIELLKDTKGKFYGDVVSEEKLDYFIDLLESKKEPKTKKGKLGEIEMSTRWDLDKYMCAKINEIVRWINES